MATRRNPSLPRRNGFRPKLLALSVAAAFAGASAANPMGAQVASGTAAISSVGNTLTITNSAGAIINWQSFSIGANEVTRFVQPSAASSVLNRVVASNPSELLGQLTSNGQVFLINPAGILVGAGARVDTAGFVASTLNLSNTDFLAGRLNFGGDAGAGGVVNRGEIVTPAGGSVYLVGANVSNEGVIRTPGGETILAAGQTVRLIDTGTPGVSVEIGGGGQAANLGEISAEAGRIGIAGALVRQAGTASASSVVREGGRIFLKATDRAEIDGGKVDASSAAGEGGRIEVTGREVAVKGDSTLDASGATGGGQILVGGGYQGRDAGLANAETTVVEAGAVLKADALAAGDGGLVVAWSDRETIAKGSFSARGGVLGGGGGVIETSGHSVDFAGARVNASSSQGKSGFWLIDPYDLEIDSAKAGTISSALNSAATDVKIEATSTGCNLVAVSFSCASSDINGNGLSDIFIRSPIIKSGGITSQRLTLKAEGNIEFTSDIGANIGIWGSSGSLDVELEAGRSIIGNIIGGSTDVTTYSQVILKAGTGIGGGNPFKVNAPTVSFLNSTSGDIYLHSLLTGSHTSVSGTNSGSGTVQVFAYNGLMVPATGIVSSGDIKLSATSVDISGPVTAPANKTVYIGPYPLGGGVSNPISVAGTGVWDINNAEIANISAGKLVIGDDGNGNVATSVTIGGSTTGLTIPAGKQVKIRSAYYGSPLTGGTVNFISGFFANNIDGRLDIDAAGDVTIDRLIQSSTSGSSFFVRSGGNVALNQDIIMGAGSTIDVRAGGGLTYSGALEAPGGTVGLRADWDIYSDILKASGTGGITGGPSSLVDVSVAGDSSATGGNIQLIARPVQVDGSLWARGGDSSSGVGGAGGNVAISGTSVILNGGIDASGGYSYYVAPTTQQGAAGGAGGTVSINATAGAITIGASGTIDAYGGDGATGGTNGTGGNGGNGGTVALSATAGITNDGYVSAAGGWAGDGSGSGNGGSGGVGGTVTLSAGAVVNNGDIDVFGGDGGYAGSSGNGGNGGTGGTILLSGVTGITNDGYISAGGGIEGTASSLGIDGTPGLANTITFRSSAGGVTQTSGLLEGHVRLGDAVGNVAGNVNISDSGSYVHSWQGIVGGAANIGHNGPIIIGAAGLKAGSIQLSSSIIQAASQVGTALDTSASNGQIWLQADSLGTAAAPVSMKSGTGLVKMDVSGSFSARFDEALVSSKLSVCEPSCGTVSGGRDIYLSTATGFDITIVPETTAGVTHPYGVDGDNINLTSGRNIVFSGPQAGFTDAGTVSLVAAGGIYAPGVVKAIEINNAYGGHIHLQAREIAGPNEGLTLNPGSGNVIAHVTNGGMHLAQVSGDLATSQYFLTNDAVGSNTHLTASAGSILINGTSGLGVSTRDDALHLSAPLGGIQQSAGAPLVADGVFATARSGIFLTDIGNRFGEFTALNTTSGDIRVVNVSSPLVLGGDSVAGLADITNNGGNVFIDNTGAIISDGAIAATGTVELRAHSPITLNGPVTGAGVILQAMSSTAGNDTITINAPINAGAGGVSATAATGIVLGAAGSIVTAGPRTLTAPQIVDPTTTSLVGQSAQQQVVASTLTTTTGLSPAASGSTATTGTTSPAVTVVATTSMTTTAASPLLTGTTIGGGVGEFGGTDSAGSSAPAASSSSSESQKSAGSGDKNKQATASGNQKREGKDAPKKPAQCTG